MHLYTVVIKYMNDSMSEHEFDHYHAARDFYQHGISYTGNRVRRVEVRMNLENSNRAIWDHSWDAISKLEGLRQ